MPVRPQIAVLGTCNVDIINQVSRFASADDEVDIKQTTQSLGGSAANFAVALSGRSVPCGVMSQVGSDHWGKFISRELSQRGVDISRLKTSKESTGMSFIAVDREGERCIYNYMGATASYELEKEDIKYIKRKKWLHLTGMYVEVVEEASQHARKLSFNPGTILSTYGVDKLKETLKNTDLLFLNKKELNLLTRSKINGIKLLLDLGVEMVVLTKGKQGASLYTEEEPALNLPSKGDVQVLDTTGAGDNFAAGFMAGYLGSNALEKCLELGHQAAANHIKHWGGNKSLKKY